MEDKKKHSLEQQVTTVKLYYDLFDMISQTSHFDAGKSWEYLNGSFQLYCDEQGLPQMSADELWHELHSKLYP